MYSVESIDRIVLDQPAFAQFLDGQSPFLNGFDLHAFSLFRGDREV